MTFTSTELANMQSAQEAHMMDTCILVERIETGSVDSYGHPIFATHETTTECGLDLRASKEVENAEARWYDARIRLPLDTEYTNIDHVIVTHRHGVAVDNLRYMIVGDARRGPSGLVADLRSDPNG